jgi:hypothetical protein
LLSGKIKRKACEACPKECSFLALLYNVSVPPEEKSSEISALSVAPSAKWDTLAYDVNAIPRIPGTVLTAAQTRKVEYG